MSITSLRIGSQIRLIVKRARTRKLYAVLVPDPLNWKRMYAMGISTRSMRGYVQEMYTMEISPAEVLRITDSVLPAVQEWRNRPLESIYSLVFLDCMLFKVRVNGTVETGAIYNIFGADIEGKKDVLGLYSSENEGAKFWLGVLTELKKCGVEDIMIACIEWLERFS